MGRGGAPQEAEEEVESLDRELSKLVGGAAPPSP